MARALPTHLFTVEDYHKMGDAGIFAEDQRIELIDREIVDMTPTGRRHMASVDRLNRRFVLGVGDRAIVRVGGAVRLSGISKPQPDLVLLRPREDYYATVDADPGDVFLVVEVADTSLAYDRDVKARVYARASLPEYWIADLIGAGLMIHRDPAPDGYRRVFVVQGTDAGGPLDFPDLVIRPGDVLA